MEKLIIEGGVPLQGAIRVSGSKNAALPILFASILLDAPAQLRNIPQLRDITTTVKLLEILGCETTTTRDHDGQTIQVTPRTLRPEAPYDLVKTMRASVLVLGPLLARLGEAKVALPGGCAIGARPVDLHLSALEKMGAHFELASGYILGRCSGLHGADITFDFPTVGGTENLLMAASLAKGRTILRNVAKEPEIVDLAEFLLACGAKIMGHGTDTLTIDGVASLHGCEYAVMPDRIEAGTFLVAGAITGGELLVQNCTLSTLTAVAAKLKEMGLMLAQEADGIRISCPNGVQGADISTQPYPGFPTDMQAQLMALLSVASGASTVEENIFENRFMHVPELNRMGADIRLSGSKAVLRGVKELVGAPVMASDLRASASLVLAGLRAQGVTEVQRIYHLDRGYEHIEKKLNAVGARIRRSNA